MSRVLEDMNEIPQEWFDELPQDCEPTISDLKSIDFNLYVSQCPELLGNMTLKLFLGKDSYYYMLMRISQPIGDHGTTWTKYWYKCEKEYIGKIKNILQKDSE